MKKIDKKKDVKNRRYIKGKGKDTDRVERCKNCQCQKKERKKINEIRGNLHQNCKL
jgi:hypothetical protein